MKLFSLYKGMWQGQGFRVVKLNASLRKSTFDAQVLSKAFSVVVNVCIVISCSCSTLLLGLSPHVPRKTKRGIEKNESEQPAGTVHEVLQENQLVREIIISNEFFHFFFISDFDFLEELNKLNKYGRSLACDFYFVCASQKT